MHAKREWTITRQNAAVQACPVLIFLCPLCLSSLDDHAKMSEFLTFIHTREGKYIVHVQCSVQYTLLLLDLMLVMSYCA
jgi:predicted transporter